MENDCKKTKFASREIADSHVKKFNESIRKRETTPIRSYLCEKCNCWHVTSKDTIKDALLKEAKNEILALNRKVSERDILIAKLKKEIHQLNYAINKIKNKNELRK